MRWAGALAGLVLVACTKTEAPPPATQVAKAKVVRQPTVPLPGADRVFAVDLDNDGIDEVVGADKGELWAASDTGQIRWKATGPGVVQRVAMGDYGTGRKLFVVRGVGRGFLKAPLVLQAIDPKSGAVTELWRNTGERNDSAHITVADVDADGAAELSLAYYASKYMVATRTWEKDGTTRTGPEVRMASSHAYGDLDSDGKVDHAVGRVYGDARGVSGDLRVRLATGPTSVPTQDGVRAVLIAKIGADTAPALYFADGWVAAYGDKAKAQVKRAAWVDGKLTVSLVGSSSDEFTFFSLTAVDVDGDGKSEIVAQGNKRLTVFSNSGAAWTSRPVGALDAILNVAVGRTPAGPVAYLPASPVAEGDRQTRRTTLR